MENLEERNTLPKTKWNIPQPTEDSPREEAMQTGERTVSFIELTCHLRVEFVIILSSVGI